MVIDEELYSDREEDRGETTKSCLPMLTIYTRTRTLLESSAMHCGIGKACKKPSSTNPAHS